mgnify:CR=1 FL=1
MRGRRSEKTCIHWGKLVLENQTPEKNIRGKKIRLENLSYWNVELQEAYYSHEEAQLKRETLEKP